jgi:predicted MFS family arabinose efflux permease
MLLAAVYVVASLAQIVVGVLIDRVSLKWLYGGIVLAQLPLFWFAAHAQGWLLYVLMIAFMTVVFGSIPFTDAVIVRYVDDRMRSRIAGMRFAVAFGASALAVWALGPLVKASGFSMLLIWMALISLITFCAILALPDQRQLEGHAAGEAAPARGGD